MTVRVLHRLLDAPPKISIGPSAIGVLKLPKLRHINFATHHFRMTNKALSAGMLATAWDRPEPGACVVADKYHKKTPMHCLMATNALSGDAQGRKEAECVACVCCVCVVKILYTVQWFRACAQNVLRFASSAVIQVSLSRLSE